jgi:hypothetical protein
MSSGVCRARALFSTRSIALVEALDHLKQLDMEPALRLHVRYCAKYKHMELIYQLFREQQRSVKENAKICALDWTGFHQIFM